jgi:hypothetical protein
MPDSSSNPLLTGGQAHLKRLSMDNADFYRKLADEALQLSRVAESPEARAAIEEIAYTWSRLAREHRGGSVSAVASAQGGARGASE